MEKTAISNSKGVRQTCWLFLAALTLFYLSLTPGTIEGQGYNRENLIAADQVVINAINAVAGRPLVKVEWTRHGFVEPMFHLPFAAISQLLPGDTVKWAGRLAILQPMLATSLLCTLLLIWVYRLTGSFRWAVLLAVSAGIGTMLWPYVYVGLETTQSLALFVAAFIALGREPKHSWPEVLLFAFACAVAVTVKLNGVFLAPAIGFLIFGYCRVRAAHSEVGQVQNLSRQIKNWKLVAVLTTIAVFYALNHLAKSRYWSGMDAGVSYFFDILTDSPLTAALQAFAFFGSPNKSLFLFCPILFLSLVTLGGAWRRQPAIVIFTLLALGGLVCGFSITRVWTDETWGPRYLHATIAPLTLCLAAAKSSAKFHWQQTLPVFVLLVAGSGVSLLGSFFPYGVLHVTAIQTSQATLETLQHDPRWNHLRFNWRLMKIWAVGNSPQPELWPPPPRWWFVRPDDAPPEKTVDLRELANPQPMLAQRWRTTMQASPKSFSLVRILTAVFLAAGLMGLAAVWRRANAIDRETE